MEKELKEFIFTFGCGQIPGIGCFCAIKAKDYQEAREVMQKRTNKYSFQYSSREEAGVERYNLREVFWDENFRGWQDHE